MHDHAVNLRRALADQHLVSLMPADDVARDLVPDHRIDIAEVMQAAFDFFIRRVSGLEVFTRIVFRALEFADRQFLQIHFRIHSQPPEHLGIRDQPSFRRAADCCFWALTPGPEFRGNLRERGPRSLRNRSQGFEGPLGAARRAGRRWAPGAGAAAAAGRGARRGAAQAQPGWGTAGRAGRGRRRAKTGPRGHSRAGYRGGGVARAGAGRQRAFSGAHGPRGGRGGRQAKTGPRGPAARTWRQTGPKSGGAASGAAFRPAGAGRTRGGRGLPAGAFRRARGGPGAARGAKGRVKCLGVCRVFAEGKSTTGGAARKNPVFAYKEARFPPAFLCRMRAVLPRKHCAFHRVAISAAQSDECVAAEKRAAAAGGRSRRAKGRKPRENPDFRH